MTQVDASDQELIAGCLSGDAPSWDAFVERFARLVHWSIRRSFESAPPGGREDFCREVFQDFFAHLIDHNELSRLRSVSNLRKFLSVKACHLAMDRLKSLSRHSKKMGPVEDLADGDEPAFFLDGGAAPDDLEEALSGSMRDLSAKERACLHFYIVEGKTANQVGRILGLSENNVHSVVRRSKGKLRELLVEKGYKDLEGPGWIK